jgi:hypothetical protein
MESAEVLANGKEKLEKMNKELQSFNKRLKETFRSISGNKTHLKLKDIFLLFNKIVKDYLENISSLRLAVKDMITKLAFVIAKKSGKEMIDDFTRIFSTTVNEIPAILTNISRRYNQILYCMIKGRNTHFTGEKEEKMPFIRQNLHDVIDIYGDRESHDPISYFKRKCLKSQIISEEIEDLKCDEECGRNRATILKNYTYDERRFQDRLKKEDFFDLENDKMDFDIAKFGFLFKKITPKNDMDFTIENNRIDGNIVRLECQHRLTIAIRLDKTNKIPVDVCFSKYKETNSKGKLLKPESTSKSKYMRSVQELAISVINTYVSYQKVPIIYFCEW